MADAALKQEEMISANQPTVEDMLIERGERYGKFEDHARISQDLKNVLYRHLSERKKALAPDQAEALEMIMHKIARIVNGDPDYEDNFYDIAGYAQLVGDRLRGISR